MSQGCLAPEPVRGHMMMRFAYRVPAIRGIGRCPTTLVGGVTLPEETLVPLAVDMLCNEPVTSVRLPRQQNDYFVINFHLASSGVHIATGTQPEVLNSTYNVVLESALLPSEIQVEANAPFQILAIVMSQDWIAKNLLKSYPADSYIRQVFASTTAIFLLETINYRLSAPIHNIISREQASGFAALSDTILIIRHFLDQLQQRATPNTISSIAPHKIKAIVHSKDQIERSWAGTISVEALARNAGMSLSSYKRAFKQVLGYCLSILPE